MFNFRTDLADERRDLYRKANSIENEVNGVETEVEDISEKIKVTRVKIVNEEGEQAIGKPKGDYITIDIKKINLLTDEELEKSSQVLAEELKKLISEKVQFKDDKGVVEHIKPKLLIVIDALASRSMERISSTIQISNTGIVPGAGVGNTRKEISINTLGIPVIAIGIPTVVETAVVVNDALNIFIEKLQQEAKSNDYLNELKEKDNYNEIKEALLPKEFNFIVTPKEIDELVLSMSEVVAKGINMAL